VFGRWLHSVTFWRVESKNPKNLHNPWNLSSQPALLKEIIPFPIKGIPMATTDATAKFTRDASTTVESLQEGLSAMRDDVGKLSQQVVDLLSAKGGDAYKRARKNLDATAGEATDAVRDVRDNFASAIDESIQERPYTTLAIALGIGLVIGAMWRR
jgi:ElaB/YqjD/DUF883 family membrane-anchored ribosome-binding protein